MPAPLVPRLADLEDHDRLALWCGPFDRLEREEMPHPGFSGARFERLRLVSTGRAPRRLVLKRVRLDADWTARLTGDRAGREAAIASDPALDAIWSVYRSPYVACAVEGGAMGLLMDDVSAHLLPDVRAPLAAADERRLLESLARLHARFADSPALAHPALAATPDVLAVLGPGTAEREASREHDHPVFSRAREGWRIALANLSPAARALLERTPARFEGWAEGLPRTLLHGDSKVANFALVADGGVAAFDWSLTLAGPAPLELGYYLAMNAKRLSASRTAALAAWRAAYESATGAAFGAAAWRRFEELALVAGATLVLWSKALALAGGAAAARDEWATHTHGLDRLARELR